MIGVAHHRLKPKLVQLRKRKAFDSALGGERDERRGVDVAVGSFEDAGSGVVTVTVPIFNTFFALSAFGTVTVPIFATDFT